MSEFPGNQRTGDLFTSLIQVIGNPNPAFFFFEIESLNPKWDFGDFQEERQQRSREFGTVLVSCWIIVVIPTLWGDDLSHGSVSKDYTWEGLPSSTKPYPSCPSYAAVDKHKPSVLSRRSSAMRSNSTCYCLRSSRHRVGYRNQLAVLKSNLDKIVSCQ